MGWDVFPGSPMNHWKLKGEVPPAPTVSVVEEPRLMLRFCGCAVIEGGLQTGAVTVTVAVLLSTEPGQEFVTRTQ